ncbi:hypothetical protein NC652_027910 [Populus alba x Populus x berolinensis]|nr:hypothetical protein NC652_027910 [Populus alba x Populus x berolinensis]
MFSNCINKSNRVEEKNDRITKVTSVCKRVLYAMFNKITLQVRASIRIWKEEWQRTWIILARV